MRFQLHPRSPPTSLADSLFDVPSSVPAAEFQANLLAFLERLRFDFPGTPFFVMNGWGWPSANAPPAFWYPEVYPAVVEQR